jgi:hypothetical protein
MVEDDDVLFLDVTKEPATSFSALLTAVENVVVMKVARSQQSAARTFVPLMEVGGVVVLKGVTNQRNPRPSIVSSTEVVKSVPIRTAKRSRVVGRCIAPPMEEGSVAS